MEHKTTCKIYEKLCFRIYILYYLVILLFNATNVTFMNFQFIVSNMYIELIYNAEISIVNKSIDTKVI